MQVDIKVTGYHGENGKTDLIMRISDLLSEHIMDIAMTYKDLDDNHVAFGGCVPCKGCCFIEVDPYTVGGHQ